MMSQQQIPDISVAVTTYNRPEFLSSCVQSILDQSVSDFEILIGNDYTDTPVTKETLGLIDSRIVIFNHASTLGEVNNINFLLKASRGKYFTCVADDDCLFPTFLEATIKAMTDITGPSVVFTNYHMGPTFPDDTSPLSPTVKPRVDTKLLIDYVTRQIPLQGTVGLFKREFLLALGGVPKLSGFSPYSDVFLALKCALNNSAAYLPVQLYFFRTHANSISFTSTDSDAYLAAQKTVIATLLPVITKERTRKEAHGIVVALLKWFANDYRRVLIRSGLDKLKGRGSLLMPHMFRSIAPAALMGNPFLIFTIFLFDIRRLVRWIANDLRAHVLPTILSRPKNPSTKTPAILPRWLCK